MPPKIAKNTPPKVSRKFFPVKDLWQRSLECSRASEKESVTLYMNLLSILKLDNVFKLKIATFT
jgi:hypothetical protein